MFLLIVLMMIATAVSTYTVDTREFERVSSFVSISYRLQPADADWLIVGAGPAGIAVTGVLIDLGVQPEKITWLDPEFNVGRMGTYYENVPANNKCKDFLIFLNSCREFQQCAAGHITQLEHQNPEDHPYLRQMIEVLQTLTGHLRTRINSVEATMKGLHFYDGLWHVGTDDGRLITAQHVILATGSHPKIMEYEKEKIVPLDLAIDQYKLRTLIEPDDVVGVVGGAHSAILILKFLSEMPVKHIYNFYRSPISYSVDRGDWILASLACFDKTIGLYGIAAQWASEVLEQHPPENITRIKIEKDTLATMLPLCSKVIYAIGFEQNPLPLINGTQPITATMAGQIAPRLFGIGIAFPEPMPDYDQTGHFCVGLRCFMRYILANVPQWVQSDEFKHQEMLKRMEHLADFGDLFTIKAL